MTTRVSDHNITLARWRPSSNKRVVETGACVIRDNSIILELVGDYFKLMKFQNEALKSDVIFGEALKGHKACTLYGLTVLNVHHTSVNNLCQLEIHANYAVLGREPFDLRKGDINSISSRYDDLQSVAYLETVEYHDGMLISDKKITVTFLPVSSVLEVNVSEINAEIEISYQGNQSVGFQSFSYECYPALRVKFKNGAKNIKEAINVFVNVENIIRLMLGVMIERQENYNILQKTKTNHLRFLLYGLGGEISQKEFAIGPHDTAFHPNEIDEFKNGLEKMCNQYEKYLEVRHDFSRSLAPGNVYSLERAAQICRCFEGTMRAMHGANGIAGAFSRIETKVYNDVRSLFIDLPKLKDYAKQIRHYWAHGNPKNKPSDPVLEQISLITEKMITLCHAIHLKSVGISCQRARRAAIRRCGIDIEKVTLQ